MYHGAARVRLRPLLVWRRSSISVNIPMLVLSQVQFLLACFRNEIVPQEKSFHPTAHSFDCERVDNGSGGSHRISRFDSPTWKLGVSRSSLHIGHQQRYDSIPWPRSRHTHCYGPRLQPHLPRYSRRNRECLRFFHCLFDGSLRGQCGRWRALLQSCHLVYAQIWRLYPLHLQSHPILTYGR